ncbi:MULTISPECIES: division/cell wall cluster transcriptional repressor MraZ [Oceanospirillaceae]|jgi:MraZ protein|uniref:division/cell wall cluster transcriptional repressor MraZ n=1 Tax=Oceanospirillaceae TaxID=135620 RepID=UPI000C47E047|nr:MULTISPECIES: division/cell wall cluster transcriptional repressor MraZ [Thalassolituus]MAY16012.1 cell division/cell wall cluster transcriptional repressor MraZ [Oceanospirillaceae bacterium]PIQ42031.1 MAG: cell division/cell wall cluster transcriptional repressor MraZ [Thalassolituus sp. CG17_big_fil_post_rev_8_21_14_2_50_53_8]MCA6060433.1 division/cell wall cluster transcriptional repressor MraZ [Thalassolituus sp. ST750PaO-4]MCB2386929.1 division/cell wall cluster transcriptional repress|tara:strand:- start:74 stop:529 length:456 start_codon:yes stop_codon:yes gene_type:complete
MFRGLHTINLDAKGRLAIPTKYRETLAELCGARLVATIDTEERCLLIYPVNEWELIQAKIEALPSFNPVARRIQRLLIGHATDLELDSAGRILLPQPLREYASLEKESVLMGQGKKLELWSKSLWEDRRDEYLDMVSQPEQLPEELQSLSL